ncbi:insulin receptor substrate 2-B isoform X1 [Osmerus eperlanus]|uniref:insulin receptor substrate 2-B isoform X1 n=2 Tax=Osmerus eperlanus TaxID=29151 RepID=UPI002E11C8B7
MANFTNYQESRGAMLMLEQRAIGTKPAAAAANGDTSVGEPPSPLINIGGGGSRFHQHLPPSNHHHHHSGHLLYPQTIQPKDQQHPLAHHCQAAQQQHLSGEHIQESPVRKSSSSSLNLVHEDPVAAVATTSHAYAASLSGTPSIAASANVSVSTSDVVDDIRKCGYLRKQKHGHKRFFVLRAASNLGPSRLEYYDSEKKFRNCLRSAAAAAASGAVAPSPPKRVIYLYQCFTVNKRADSKNKHLIALYTKDEYFAIVAENEQEQEDWYVALSELMSEGKRGHLDSDDLDDGYGTVTPGTVFKEVWQVHVKPKGLGQTKNLTGVYRLCLSTKTIHLVKLNSETPCVNLQLMNIRRCGHSESFFFIEVGRSSSIGPGEIWMYVDDSVVAQNMHETILETMKALKAFSEFRPRSKSQSSGTNPIAFITTRRHLGNLPPSQTGLQRRSRTESVVGTPPSSKSTGASGYRFRTSSEGEGTMNRPFRSVTGSLVHLNSARLHLGRQEGGAGSTGSSTGTGGGGGGGGSSGNRYVRALPGSTYHARSASLPVSHFPSATSPVSVSSSSGHGSVSDTLTRPSSASICGSPSDGGFNSSDEYGSSPGDFRYFRVRSNTPDSLGNTPPIREENCLNDYMAMGWHREVFGAAGNGGAETARDEGASAEDERSSSSARRRTHSFSRPAAGGASGVAVYQKMTQTAFSQDEGMGEGLSLGRPPSSSSSSLRSDYSSCSEHSQNRPAPPRLHPAPTSSSTEDSGYVPMTCGVATASPRDAPPPDYMPMQPGSSHPHPRLSSSPLLHSPVLSRRSPHPHPQPTDSHGYMMMLPGGGLLSSPLQASPSPQSSGGTAGGPGGSVSANASERPENGEYMDMSNSVGGGGGRKVSNEGYFALSTPDTPKSYSPYFSLPRSYKAPARERDEKELGEYVPMCSPAKPMYSSSSSASSSASSSTPEKRGGMAGGTPPSHPPPPYGAQHVTGVDRRVVRPNRLPLGRRSFHGSPGDGGGASANGSPAHAAAVSAATEGPSSPGEYINIEFGDQYPSSCSLSAQEGAPSLGPGDPQRSPPQAPAPQQDYMSVDVVPKSQSPRPSLVAPWNPPSYIRPLAAASGALAHSSGGHWKSGGDDYTDMTFGLGGGEGARGSRSPTAMLQHLCVMEGHYQALTLAPTSTPTAPLSSSPQAEPPKVVRADPQGRRRHSSETFTSASTHPPSASTHPPSSPTPAAPNGAHHPPEASRWPASGSFDSVWMCVEGQGGLADPLAQPGASDVGLVPAGTAPSGGGRVCHQNGLNYIALELRDEAAPAAAPHLNGSHRDGRTGSPTGALPLPENGAYASIDFSKPDGVTATSKDG